MFILCALDLNIQLENDIIDINDYLLHGRKLQP